MVYLIILLLFCWIFIFFKSLYGEQKQTLRESASKSNFLIGASLPSYPFFNDDQYKMILKNEFNLITIENDMKFS